MSTNRKSHIPLLFVLTIFILPAIAGWIMYYYHDHFNFKTLNHGTLVDQPFDAKYLYSDMQNGNQKKWRVIYVSDESCDKQCQKIDFQLHQMQKALGKNHDRIEVIRLGSENTTLKKVKESFTNLGEKNYVVINKIYLVDPIGNLFMYYPSDVDPMSILKDLKRVLEVSQIG